ncbi:MAG: hypothetical protein LBK25_08645 [Treponema sp.]|jgi:CMP-N-acetylneuraminic acid synthetase|nr:hypothetical protein [Treponema sp.]
MAEAFFGLAFLFHTEGGVKVVCMIPIKLNNERVPGKNIKRFFDGTPLMSLVQRAVLNTYGIDEVYVYCSNEEVVEYLERDVKFLKRPDFLDKNTSNCNDIIHEFIKYIDADIYAVSHATAPFTTSVSIEACIKKVKSGEYDSAFLAEKCQEFLWRDRKPLNFDAQNFPRTQDLPLIYKEAPGAYVFSKETFLRYNRRVGEKVYIHEIDEIEGWDIDYPEDFMLADLIYQGGLHKNSYNN